jgi:D-inositol-3-phosphate glycosyltransferase
MTQIRDQRSEVRDQPPARQSDYSGGARSASGFAEPTARREVSFALPHRRSPRRPKAGQPSTECNVALLTGGDDKSYALGLASALVGKGVSVDFIGSDKVDAPELHNTPLINFLNLRGDQRENVSIPKKVLRILAYYGRLIRYAASARPPIFHILWNNKFELFDRVFLMLYYRLLGRKIVLTAHNVNAAKRDFRDSFLNRVSLRIQYRLTDHIFVHTERMKCELLADFNIPESKASVIPFGINNTSPATAITTSEAKQRLGVSAGDKTALLFGQIAPYKGLEYLISAFSAVAKRDGSYRLIIAGKVKKGHTEYWNEIQRKITASEIRNQIIERIEHIPDEEVEVYFKAADVLIVPYTHISQSGVPFLAYSFGLPVIATDIGSLREDIIEGRTGFVCHPRDSSDLARVIGQYFDSELFCNLENRRLEIKQYANERYSWEKVAAITTSIYSNLLSSAL